jgi:mono/diheme cytochrome c family protein
MVRMIHGFYRHTPTFIQRLAIWSLLSLVLVSAFERRSILRAQAEQPRTTLAGVFTQAQANHGEETYMTICVACHPAGTYTGATFKTAWNGRPVSDLYSVIKDRMPKNEPGSLSPDEAAQLVAYILKVNNVPAGKTDLPSDVAPLKEIRIEIPDAQ